MGHFSHSCKLTGLPITGGDPATLIVMRQRKNMFDNSDEHIAKYGSTYMCSNEGTRLKFLPVWLPIHGDYDDYGGLENIIEDVNTRLLEEQYGLDIQTIVNVLTSGRKDDGYDDILKAVKKPFVYPEDWQEGEKHFQYYQRTQNKPMPFGDGVYPDVRGAHVAEWQEEGYEGWTIVRDGKRIKATKEQYDADFKLIHDHYAEYKEWSKEHPDPEGDYGNPQYEEKYKELISYSGMWIRRDVYEQLTDIPRGHDSYGNHLDYGKPQVLKALGFEMGTIDKSKGRYNIPFTKGNLTVYSDGTWIDGSIYSIENFRKLAESAGEEIDFTPLMGKSLIEQMIDITLPSLDIINKLKEQKGETVERSESQWNKMFDKAKETMPTVFNKADMTLKRFKEFMNLTKDMLHLTRDEMSFMYKFLNGDYSDNKLRNQMTIKYLENANELKDALNRFWLFDYYMYTCGRYYEIVGTAPQDGEHKDVLNVLKVATSILEKEVKERWEDDEDEEE